MVLERENLQCRWVGGKVLKLTTDLSIQGLKFPAYIGRKLQIGYGENL
jgi:hypothetical protein